MKDWPIFFLTNDPWRGVGLETIYDNYHIICVDDSEYVDHLTSKGHKVFSLARELGEPNPIVRNTRKLLLHPLVIDYMLKNSADKLGIVFFKPQFDLHNVLRGTELINKRDIVTMNPSPTVARKLENKLDFYELCKKYKMPTPPTLITRLDSTGYNDLRDQLGDKFVVQFETGWFGNRTFFIANHNDLTMLKSKYKDRPIKVSAYIDGIVLTNNVVITRNGIYQTYPFLQVLDSSGKLARMKGSTVGNAWLDTANLPVVEPNTVVQTIRSLTDKLGNIALKDGFLGYAGFDFLVDKRGDVYVQEMNARFTASAPMVAQLEREFIGSSILDAHYKAFHDAFPVETTPDKYFIPLSGARIIARNITSEVMLIDKPTQNGIYSLSDSELKLVRRDLSLSGLGLDEFLLVTPATGRLVNPDQEILHLMSTTGDYEKIKEKAKQIKRDICTGCS